MKHYNAPWGRSLIVISTVATAVCLGVSIVQWQSHHRFWSSWPALLPVSLIVGCALYSIRGYTLSSDTLLVHRLIWSTRIPLADLQSAEVQPSAMKGSIRVFGNGGLFSFTGRYWNRTLGTYRAFVTDLNRTAILRFANRTIVLSPESPEDFVAALPVNR